MLTLLMFPDFTLYLPSWNAKEPTETLDHDEPSRLIVAKMITVQLLASCFTSLQDINAVTLPSAWYRRQHRANDKGGERRLISSLRQHTQSKYSPAYGHHARNNSAVSSWPDQGRELSREDCLAEQVSRKRFSRRRERRAMRESVVAKFRSQDEPSEDESRRYGLLPLRHRRHRISTNTPISRQFSPSHYYPLLVPQDSEDIACQTNISRLIRGP